MTARPTAPRLLAASVALVLLSSLGLAQADNGAKNPSDMLPDAAAAMKVGSALIETWMGEQSFRKLMQDHTLHIMLRGDEWHIYAYPSDAYLAREQREADRKFKGTGQQAVIVVADGGPELVLSKRDARVKSIH